VCADRDKVGAGLGVVVSGEAEGAAVVDVGVVLHGNDDMWRSRGCRRLNGTISGGVAAGLEQGAEARPRFLAGESDRFSVRGPVGAKAAGDKQRFTYGIGGHNICELTLLVPVRVGNEFAIWRPRRHTAQRDFAELGAIDPGENCFVTPSEVGQLRVPRSHDPSPVR
jgi:hypothetical protein